MALCSVSNKAYSCSTSLRGTSRNNHAIISFTISCITQKRGACHDSDSRQWFQESSGNLCNSGIKLLWILVHTCKMICKPLFGKQESAGNHWNLLICVIYEIYVILESGIKLLWILVCVHKIICKSLFGKQESARNHWNLLIYVIYEIYAIQESNSCEF